MIKGSKQRKVSKTNIPATSTAQQLRHQNLHSLYSNEIINTKSIASNNGEKRLIKIAKKKRTSVNSNRNNLTSTSADSSSHHEQTNDEENDHDEEEQEEQEEYDEDPVTSVSFKDVNGRSYSESHLSPPQVRTRQQFQHINNRSHTKQTEFRHTTIVMSQSTRTDLNYDLDNSAEEAMNQSAGSDKSVSSSNIYDLYKVILEPGQVRTGNEQRPRRYSGGADASNKIDEIRVNDLINIDMELGADHRRNENSDSIDNLMLSALSPPVLLHSSSPNNTASLSATTNTNSITPSSQYSPDSFATKQQEQQISKQQPSLLVVENIESRIVRTTITTTNVNDESELIEEPVEFTIETPDLETAQSVSNKNVEFVGLVKTTAKIDGNFLFYFFSTNKFNKYSIKQLLNIEVLFKNF
jgi:hypothetical protein